MNETHSGYAYERMSEALRVIEVCWTAPHVLIRPRVFRDGNRWCALHGENIQEGVCGFGITPEAACMDFDRAWRGLGNEGSK